jgi:hypothetical protein
MPLRRTRDSGPEATDTQRTETPHFWSVVNLGRERLVWAHGRYLLGRRAGSTQAGKTTLNYLA